MEECQHPLFFEVKNLTDREKEEIRRHFLKRQDSGGGECGGIENVGGNNYRICFKDVEDRERVLQRKFHTISLPSGELCLTVRRTSSPKNPNWASTSQSQTFLERSLSIRRELPVVEKQFKLVKEVFCREMREQYPEVKLLISTDMIILEGPDNKVQSGATKLDELVKKIKVKKVKLSTALINFIKSSGVLSKHQARFQWSFRHPVSLEVGSDLVLSSFSSDALDEAEAALTRDLTLANVPLQGAAAVPPDLDRLKEILTKAKNVENCDELKVDVSFIPGASGTTKVRLVGYSDTVNKLKEVLQDYQINQVETQEVIKLPRPELLDCFDKIIDLSSIKKNKVDLKPSHLPYPCVLVSGPRCQVQEAQQALNSVLASLTSDTLVLDGPGAQRYFQAEGKVGKDLVENSCQVIISDKKGGKPSQQSSSAPRPIPKLRRKSTLSIPANKTRLDIRLGSLEDEQVNVLVVPKLNRQLSSTNIGKCLSTKARNSIKTKFDSMAANSTIAPGDVLQVKAPPSLGCSKLSFIECLPWDGVRGQSVQTFLEGSLSIRRELPVVEKQFKLVEEVFFREMREQYPEVNLVIGSGMIILEGPDNKVQSGAAKLDELLKKIKVKTVKLSTALINFIKSSGVISKHQTRFQQSFRHPVSLEVGSDLVLSSFSSDALDEAEAVLMRDLTLANVPLQGAAAVPPDLDRLKEILTRAKNEANCDEFRVDVSFIPGASGTTKVRLVGYSDTVDKLKEVLQDYQINQAETQEVIKLPRPELLDCCDIIIEMATIKKNTVDLKPSHLPYPCVLVSGPRSQVQEAQQALNWVLANLISDTLVLDGPGAQRYFQAEGKVGKNLVENYCQVIITDKQGVKPLQQSSSAPQPILRLRRESTMSIPANKTRLDIRLGSLEDEQVNVLVVPMLNRQLSSTNIGKCLLRKAGNSIKTKFDMMAAYSTIAPGDVLQVDAPPSLGCSKLFFIECLPWDGVRGLSVQVLRKGLKSCLDLCVQQGLSSVAFPVIGPGIVLKYLPGEAIQVLTDSIRQFGLQASSGSLSSIHIVIKPGYPDSEECYHDVYTHLSLIMNQGDQAIFRSLISDLDDVTMTVGGGVKLQLVFGDITDETTDAVVNTTNFVDFGNGVCKDILTVAGPEVEYELITAYHGHGDIFVSGAGFFPCKSIFHVNGKRDVVRIQRLVGRVVEYCETFGYKSVAIPAICAGAGRLDPGVVAGAILRGVKAATSSSPLYCLTDIRLVLITINDFLAFKEEAMQMFSTAVVNKGPQLQFPPVQHLQQQQPPSSVCADINILQTTSRSQQSIFIFLGVSRKNVNNAMRKLKKLYQSQCSTKTLKKEELAGLTQDDMIDLKQLVEAEGLYVQKDPTSQGSFTVSGLKDGVNKVTQMINASLQGCLRREVRAREEEELYSRVSWCILGQSGYWKRLPKTANHNLENKEVAGGITDAENIQWSVDLQRMEATTLLTRQTAQLKRLQHLPDFTLPLYWDNMAEGETMKVVALQPSSAEFRTVKKGFKRTVQRTVMRIKRVQNVHLRRAYEAQKKQISDKNKQQGGAEEKLLYHGTTQESCDSIMKTGFNRRFCGQNATSYGKGTYFAVNASYSAKPTYSKPAADGSQLMFVSRVLTGFYTQGHSDMKVPPVWSPLQPHDRYDSVVDRMDRPNMFVVFHDSQAYPDYLITFK